MLFDENYNFWEKLIYSISCLSLTLSKLLPFLPKMAQCVGFLLAHNRGRLEGVAKIISPPTTHYIALYSAPRLDIECTCTYSAYFIDLFWFLLYLPCIAGAQNTANLRNPFIRSQLIIFWDKTIKYIISRIAFKTEQFSGWWKWISFYPFMISAFLGEDKFTYVRCFEIIGEYSAAACTRSGVFLQQIMTTINSSMIWLMMNIKNNIN